MFKTGLATIISYINTQGAYLRKYNIHQKHFKALQNETIRKVRSPNKCILGISKEDTSEAMLKIKIANQLQKK